MKPGMVRTWILDASPLILLHKIDFLKTISEFARTWLIPGIVVQEIEEKNSIDSYRRELSYKSQVEIIKMPCIIPSIAAWDLGPGECEVISNALERKNVGVILDDLEARKCARVYNLPLKGTLGLIVWAKKAGLIDKLKPHFDNLINAGIRIERNIINDLLKAANEL